MPRFKPYEIRIPIAISIWTKISPHPYDAGLTGLCF
jgi:hypothetical protein